MNSIRRQLLRTLLPAILLLAVASGSGLYVFAGRVLTRQFDAALLAKAKAVAAAVVWDDEHPTAVTSPDQSAAEFSGDRHPAYFEALWVDGTPALRSRSLAAADLPISPNTSAREGTPWDVVLPNGRSGRAVQISFVPGHDADDKERFIRYAGSKGGARGKMKLILGQGRAGVDEPLQVLAISLAIAIGLMAAGTVVVVAVAVHRSLRPLMVIAEEAARKDAYALDQPFPVKGMPIELAPICHRLNELLGRVQEAYRRERRFTADVSHELRTPIAELKSLAEVALKFPGDAPSAEGSFRDALAVARQMESIVTTLLSLARCESAQQRPAFERVDLARLMTNAWQRVAARASKRGLCIDVNTPPQLMVESDPTLLDAIATNLLSNAVDHSSEGGNVSWRVSEESGSPVVEVANTAEPLTPEDLSRMFEPFWRKDHARSNSDHFGLGLSLAAAYAKVLDCELSADMPGADCLRLRLRVGK